MGLKFKLYAIIFVIGMALAGGGVYYVTNLQKENKQLHLDNSELTTSLENKTKELELKETDYAAAVSLKNRLKRNNASLASQLSSLEDKFNKVRADGTKRDMGALGVSKTGLIKKIVNNGTREANECVEIASGKEVKADEKNTLCQPLVDMRKPPVVVGDES